MPTETLENNETKEIKTENICPDCGFRLTHTCACTLCIECGFSECG